MTTAERLEQRQRIAAAREQRRQAEEAERARCRERAAGMLEEAQPASPDHPYLVAKQVIPCGILQVEDRLVIPQRDADGVLQGLQFIGPGGRKRYLLGTAKQGCWHVIGNPGTARRLIIAEGFATAASIHMATGDPVAIAFDKHNLLPVADALNRIFPELRIVVAGDNDADGGGQEKAREAAAAVGGTPIIPATVKDWNDLATAEGLEAVRSAFILAQDDALVDRGAAWLLHACERPLLAGYERT